MLILTKYVAKHEFDPLRKNFDIDDLLDGADKVLRGLGQKMNPLNNTEYRFFKVRIGSKVKGRMIVFVVSENKKVIPILIRLKKDKKMGMNMSAQNPYVTAQVEKNLAHAVEDIEKGWFEKFDF